MYAIFGSFDSTNM